MKMRDKDGSVVALAYVFAAYPLDKRNEFYMLEVYSPNKVQQVFYYHNQRDMEADLGAIDLWVSSREL